MKTEKTCKDCKWYEPFNNGKYVIKCTKPGMFTYWRNIDKCNDFKPKIKDMKKIKVDQKTIKRYVEQFKNCSEAQTMLRADFPEVFKSELPKTWEEFCELKDYVKLWGKPIDERNDFSIPNKYVAQRKLEKLRDHYNDGWKVDWENDSQNKYVIFKYHNGIETNYHSSTERFLYFKNPELRDEFLTNFKELIKEAKDLI